jgi:hypothetical protein
VLRASHDDGAVNAKAFLDPRGITSVVLAPVQDDLDLAIACERSLQVGEEVALIARHQDDPFSPLG